MFEHNYSTQAAWFILLFYESVKAEKRQKVDLEQVLKERTAGRNKEMNV